MDMLPVGTRYQRTHTITQEEINRFAVISGDTNPIHIDPVVAATSRFGCTIAHGMLLYGHIRAALRILAPQAVQRTQTLSFTNPVFADDQVTIEVEVIERQETTIRCAVSVTRQDRKMACSGETELEIRA
jgi:acyl dehydratase